MSDILFIAGLLALTLLELAIALRASTIPQRVRWLAVTSHVGAGSVIVISLLVQPPWRAPVVLVGVIALLLAWLALRTAGSIREA